MNKSYISIIEFEEALSKYTNAPYVVATDGCTHAIELAMRYYNIKKCSFKPMSLGKVGAILLDDKEAYIELSKMRSDGRDLKKYPIPGPIEWFAQKIFKNGYHYCPSIENCEKGAKLIQNYKGSVQDFKYYDCRQTLVIYL